MLSKNGDELVDESPRGVLVCHSERGTCGKQLQWCE